jgi:hypothetical protein
VLDSIEDVVGDGVIHERIRVRVEKDGRWKGAASINRMVVSGYTP